MSVNLRFSFCEISAGINVCVRNWNSTILLLDQLEEDLHRNDRQIWLLNLRNTISIT
jgi:hypothetical protein